MYMINMNVGWIGNIVIYGVHVYTCTYIYVIYIMYTDNNVRHAQI